MKKNQQGFGAPEAVIILLIIGVMSFTGWHVLKQKDENTSSSITNFEECATAGNPVAESYQRQCSVNGQTFIEKIDQQNSEQQQKTYLGIKEWGVRITLTDATRDTKYAFAEGTTPAVYIYSKEVSDKYEGCMGGGYTIV